MERVINWQGLDLMTEDSGVNPLIASHIGAPYQVRGTDPADYGRAAFDYWQQNASSVTPDGVASSVTSGVAAVTGDASGAAGASLWDKVKTGTLGGLLGIVVVALGLALIIWGRD